MLLCFGGVGMSTTGRVQVTRSGVPGRVPA
jgi:hypothetical protein